VRVAKTKPARDPAARSSTTVPPPRVIAVAMSHPSFDDTARGTIASSDGPALALSAGTAAV
jgi:hypothetical protein